MANNAQLRGTPFTAISSGTVVAIATTTATGVTYYVTDINGSSTTAGTWAIIGGTTGTTTFWAGIGNVNEDFIESLKTNGTITFLFNGTISSYANISGYFI